MKEFLNISKYAGMREDLVQAGGGNSSIKISPEKMLIKASGYPLAELSEQDGYAVVNPSVITEFFEHFEHMPLERSYREEEKRLLEQSFLEGKRPSIETFLHSITGRVTLHTHAVLVAILASREDGMQILQSLFPEALLVPYATPGISLAVSYFRAYRKNGNKKADLVFLQNHGLIVSGDSDWEVIERMEQVLQRIADYLSIDYSVYANTTVLYQFLVTCGVTEDIVYQVQHRRVYEAFSVLGESIWEHAVCPDCVVYCGKKILQVHVGTEAADIQQFLKQYGKPSVIQYRNQFYILAFSIKKAKEVESILAFSAELVVANQGIELSYLTEQEQDFLLDWDAEKYRKRINL